MQVTSGDDLLKRKIKTEFPKQSLKFLLFLIKLYICTKAVVPLLP